MRVLHVASEVAPFATSGGLADVLGALPAALVAEGLTVGVVVPLYRGVAARIAAAGVVLDGAVALALPIGPAVFAVTVRHARWRGVQHAFVDCPALFDRDGGFYGPDARSEFADNHVRFAVLGAAALAAGPALLGGAIDVLHVHDWQGGPAALYARLAGAGCAIVATIHNLAFRGIVPKSAMAPLGLPWSLFTPSQLEFYDQVSLLKGALSAADAVTTVSPTYAREILTPARGEGLDEFLRHDVAPVVGILNGIDMVEWDPATDAALPARFDVDALAGKALCRRALVAECGFAPVADGQPVIGVVSRMSDQKGLDLLADLVPALGARGARLVVMGSGDPALESRWRYLASVFRAHVFVHIGFDASLARRIFAGTDLFAMPSRFEPCGLAQLYALRYGSIPLASPVGGLRDTLLPIPAARPSAPTRDLATLVATDLSSLVATAAATAAGAARPRGTDVASELGGTDPSLVDTRPATLRAAVAESQAHAASAFVSGAGAATPRIGDEIATSVTMATGICFEPLTAAAFLTAFERAIALMADRVTFAQVQRNGMLRDSSWRTPARAYAALYASLRPKRANPRP